MTELVPPDQRDRQLSASERRRQDHLRATMLQRSLQRVMYFATVTDDAIRKTLALGPTWRLALTADPSYEPTMNQVAYLREHAQDRLDVWVQPLEVDAGRVQEFQALLGTKDRQPIRQAEDQEQLDECLRLGSTRIVGNANAWDADERGPREAETKAEWRQRVFDANDRSPAMDFVTSGQLAVAGECYTNVDGPWPNAYSAQGIPVSSIVIGVGKWAEAAHDYDVPEYADPARTPLALWDDVSVYAATYIRDWELLPR